MGQRRALRAASGTLLERRVYPGVWRNRGGVACRPSGRVQLECPQPCHQCVARHDVRINGVDAHCLL